MKTSTYLDFIRNAVKTEGIKVADTTNKMALQTGSITLTQYSKAARILVDAFLAQPT